MNLRLAVSIGALGLVTVSAALAHADIPPPNEAQCNGLKVGDPCVTDDKQDAGCSKSTCSKHDYSNGTPPETVEYDCLVCGKGDPRPPSSCSMAGGSAIATPWWAALALPLLLRRRRAR